MIEKIELREIEIKSPLENLKIGDNFLYKGNYRNGYEEGISKIKRFYKEVSFWKGVEKNENSEYAVLMELENKKIILLGFIKNKSNFKLSENYSKNYN